MASPKARAPPVPTCPHPAAGPSLGNSKRGQTVKIFPARRAQIATFHRVGQRPAKFTTIIGLLRRLTGGTRRSPTIGYSSKRSPSMKKPRISRGTQISVGLRASTIGRCMSGWSTSVQSSPIIGQPEPRRCGLTTIQTLAPTRPLANPPAHPPGPTHRHSG